MSRRVVADVAATPHFDFLYGAFTLSKWKIPYFATTMTLTEAAESLHLTTEIPGAERIEWKVNELFQRDIDWPRVERQILPYLRNAEVPQFFNSITVALLPYNPEAGELLQAFKDDVAWEPPSLVEPDRFAKRSTIGPVTFGHWSDWATPQDREFQTGQMRWNVKQLFGVAIDGQHRLAAIKLLIKASSEVAAFRNTRLPVILLLFDERLGFSAPHDTSQVSLLRALFIDLNKHARTVSRARQILLDDRDPHAVCVRRLVGNQLTAHLDELSSLPPRLPLSLVDWHSEQAKFDSGPYLSTVLGLDWIVSKVLDTRPIRDFTDYSAVRTQIERLERRLDIDLADSRLRVDDLANVKLRPFVYTDGELDEIAEGFAQVWSMPIASLLTRFSPYAGLVDHRRSDGTLSLDFQYWYELFQRQQDDPFAGHATAEYRQLLGRLANRDHHPVAESALKAMLGALEDLKAENLAFNVVFQRALVEAFLEYAKIGAEHIEELELMGEDELDVDFDDEYDVDEDADYYEEVSYEDEDDGTAAAADGDATGGLRSTVAARSGEFIAAMNRLVEGWPDILTLNASYVDESGSQPFWLGTLLKAEGGIDFTQGASSRAKDLLFAGTAMWLYDDRTEPETRSDFDEFWSLCLDSTGPSVCRRVSRAITRLSRQENSAGGRILRSRSEEHEETAAQEEIYSRMKRLWNVLAL